MNRKLILLVAAALCFTTAAAHAEALKGKLLIIGGAIGNSAPLIYSTMAEQLPADATIGVIPTASGEPEASMKSAADRIRESAGGRVVKGIAITQDDAARADDAGLAQQIDTCGGLFFTGGQQDRIVDVFHPGGRDTAISRAVENVLARGGIVAGTSAGAAIMCDPMIMGGNSADALAAARVRMGKGMGYFPFGVVDQHFLERGRFGRLLVAVEQTGSDFGYGISEGRGMLVDRATGELSGVGTDSILVIDRREAKTDDKGNRTGWRISLVGQGDRIDAKTGQVTPAADRKPFYTRPRTGAADPIADAWERRAIGKLLHDFATGSHASAVAIDKTYEAHFSVDDRTAFHASADGKEIIVVNVRLDLVRKPK